MTHRLFIAINLPQNLKDKLSQLILELKKRNNSLPIKWVKPSALHLTLHFLGEIKTEEIVKIEEIINQVSQKIQQFTLKICQLGGFPNLKEPRVIYINCEEINSNKSLELQKNLGIELAKIGFRIDSRPWQRHITLGRVKSKCQPVLPRVTISEGEFKVKSIELMENELLPQGPRYGIVKLFELR